MKRLKINNGINLKGFFYCTKAQLMIEIVDARMMIDAIEEAFQIDPVEYEKIEDQQWNKFKSQMLERAKNE
jgi:uncharacterized protein YabN with tetrapyrrole methylase and pyrophosphatase domain